MSSSRVASLLVMILLILPFARATGEKLVEIEDDEPEVDVTYGDLSSEQSTKDILSERHMPLESEVQEDPHSTSAQSSSCSGHTPHGNENHDAGGTPTALNYQAQKDDRRLSRAIREASPPKPKLEPTKESIESQEDVEAAIEQWKSTADPATSNGFSTLAPEIPAPYEEDQPSKVFGQRSRRRRRKIPVAASENDFPTLPVCPVAKDSGPINKTKVLSIPSAVVEKSKATAVSGAERKSKVGVQAKPPKPLKYIKSVARPAVGMKAWADVVKQ